MPLFMISYCSVATHRIIKWAIPLRKTFSTQILVFCFLWKLDNVCEGKVFAILCLGMFCSSDFYMHFLPYGLLHRWKKAGEKWPTFQWWQIFFPDQQFYLTKINTDQKFLSVIFLLNKNQITVILKKNYQIYYAIIWLSGIGQ